MAEIYVRGVVIANGLPDADGDVLNKQEIRTLLTKFEQQTDTMHTYIKNEGVDIIENGINETPTIVAGQNVPAGSWLATTRVTNDDLIENINNGNLNAYSLGSVPLELLGEKGWFISKAEKVTYSDVADLDNVKPLFISFVDKGANGFIFEVLTRDAYINKNEDIKMSEQEKKVENNDNVSISGLTKFLQALGINKSVETVEPPVVETPTETTVGNDEFLQSIRSEVSAGVVEGFKQIQEETAKPVETPTEPKKEEPVEPVDMETPAEPVETKTETGEQIPKIDKRETTKTENIEVPQVNTNFYKMSGRDEFGRRIRK